MCSRYKINEVETETQTICVHKCHKHSHWICYIKRSMFLMLYWEMFRIEIAKIKCALVLIEPEMGRMRGNEIVCLPQTLFQLTNIRSIIIRLILFPFISIYNKKEWRKSNKTHSHFCHFFSDSSICRVVCIRQRLNWIESLLFFLLLFSSLIYLNIFIQYSTSAQRLLTTHTYTHISAHTHTQPYASRCVDWKSALCFYG